MSEVTLCLITKGRPEYLETLLESLERAIGHDSVKVLVILNGVSPEIATRFRTWQESAPGKITLETFAENEAGLNRFWPIISSIPSKWVVFPSDDDVLNENFFEEWVGFEATHSRFGAIATGLDLIDSKGSKLGITRKPSYSQGFEKSQFIAMAFRECPFLWPGLVIQVSKLPKLVPTSRYVLDWWIGLYLLLSTEVAVSDSILLNYRVHETQESAVASLARKNLEAIVHFSHLINEDIFAAWVNAASSQEIIRFLQYLVQYPSLYGDSRFSSELTSVITKRVASLREETEVQVCSQFVNALVHNVLIDEKQLKFLGFNKPIHDDDLNALNFNLELDKSVCSRIRSLFTFRLISNESFPKVSLGCQHSPPSSSQISIDCSNLNNDSSLMDTLLLRTNEYFTVIEYFENSVSPFEYGIVRKVRFIKTKIPKFLNRLVYALFGR